jgi:hypothetical protein
VNLHHIDILTKPLTCDLIPFPMDSACKTKTPSNAITVLYVAYRTLMYHAFVGLPRPSFPSALACSVASRLSNLRDISSTRNLSTVTALAWDGVNLLFAKISLETPANLFDREFNSSSTTTDSSAGADASVVVCIPISVSGGIIEISRLTEVTDS